MGPSPRMFLYFMFLLVIPTRANIPDHLPSDSLTPPQIQTTISNDFSVPKHIESLSARQKAAAMMMIGLQGKSVSKNTRRWIDKEKIGNVILFPWNFGGIQEIRNLTSKLQDMAGEWPLLVAIDQEGGRVRRLRKEVTPLPSAMTIGATGSSSLSYLSGMVTGVELKQIGFNVNLAPVLDIYTPHQDLLIGTRSFGSDTNEIIRLSDAYIRAIQNHGVSATAKHFPGHGDVLGDSHYTLPSSDLSLEEWRAVHLPPFEGAVKRDVDLIMTAHVRMPRLLSELGASEEEKMLPATLSHTLLTKVLREQLKYNGIILTDDLEMRSIKKNWPIGEAAVRAVEAGSDIVMIIWNEKSKNEVLSSLEKAILSGRIPAERIQQSLERIFKLRGEKRNLTKSIALDSKISHPFHFRTAKTIRQQGLVSFRTTLNPSGKIESIIPSKNSQVAIYASNAFSSENIRRMLQPKLKSDITIHALPSDSLLKEQDTQTHLFVLRNSSDKRTLLKFWNQRTLLPKNALSKFVFISLDSPSLLSGFEGAHALLCTFNNDILSLASLGALFKNKHTQAPTVMELSAFRSP